MSEQEDKSQQTEQPSQRKLEKAKEKGDVFSSKEVNSFLSIFVFSLCVLMLSVCFFKHVIEIITPYISSPHEIIATVEKNSASKASGDVLAVGSKLIMDLLPMMLIPALIMMIVNVASILMQQGLIFAPEVIMPQLSRISPIAGFKRLFSLNSVIELLKGIFKILLVGSIIYMAVKGDINNFSYTYKLTLPYSLHLLFEAMRKLLIGACCVMFFLAIVDYIYQRQRYMNKMKMSKRDMKDEHKEQEGSPEIKSKLRSLRYQMSKRRIMAAVPNADVVITNPTHYAVALKYDPDKMDTPIMTAKGQDNIALMIRKVAQDNKIPIVENPPLARMLYKDLEIDMPIKYEHYKLVANVISYIMALKGKKLTSKFKEK